MVKNGKKHGISISCIVNDNAAVLKEDITNIDASKFIILKAIIGEVVLRCASHTTQQEMKDLINGINFIEKLFQKVIGIISFSLKSEDFQKICPFKMPPL